MDVRVRIRVRDREGFRDGCCIFAQVNCEIQIHTYGFIIDSLLTKHRLNMTHLMH